MNSDIVLSNAELANVDREKLLERFEASLDVGDRTRREYVKNAGYYLDWLLENDRKGNKKADIIAYKRFLLERISTSSTATYITAVRVLYEFLEEYNIPNVARTIHASRRKNRAPRKQALSAGGVKHLLQTMPKNTLAELRDYAIVNVMVRTGARETEIVRANIGDIKPLGDCLALYVQGKGHTDKDDYVLLDSAAYQPIEEYLIDRGVSDPEAPLFASVSPRNKGGRLTTCTLSVMIKRALKNAGFDSDRLTGHSLRHTAVTLAIASGCSKDHVQAMARHADSRTTEIYIHEFDRIANGAEFGISSMLG